MARKAYRRPRKLKFLALATGVSILVVLAVVYAAYRYLQEAPERLIASIAENAKLSLGKIQQTATRDGKTEWRLDAASARYLEATNQVKLDDLTVTFYMDSGEQVRLSATDGVLDTRSNDIQVSGNVQVDNKDYALHTESLRYRHQQRLILSDSPVVIERKIGGRLSADKLRLDLNSNRLKLEGNVEGVFHDTGRDSPQGG